MSHRRPPFLSRFMNNLNMIYVIDKIWINLHLIPVLIYKGVSLILDMFVLDMILLIIQSIVLIHFFIVFISYFQMGPTVIDRLHCYSWRFLLLIKWRFKLRFLCVRNSLCSQSTTVTIVIRPRVYFLQVQLSLLIWFVLNSLKWLSCIGVFVIRWRHISWIIF